MSAVNVSLPGRVFNFFWNFRIVRFTGGAGVNLSTKLFLTAAFRWLGLPLWLNYGLVHAIVVVVSYMYHSRVTFQEDKRTLAGFARFFLSVLVLKLADYLVVVITNNISALQDYVYGIPGYGLFLGDHLLYIIIVLSSTVIYFFRYFLFKNLAFRQKSDPSP